jgi:anaerobic selenocysteine-containing dehydrogenase
VCLAGNPVLSTPGGDRLARALSGLEYFVAIDYYLSVTSRLAHLVLPPLTVLETGNYELLLSPLAVRNVAKYSPPAVAAPPDARNDFQIVGEIAARMYLPRAIAKSSLLRRAIAAAPDRIIDLLLRLGGSGHSLASLAAHPDGVDLGPLVPSLERHLHTPDRKLHLAPEALLEDVPRLDAWVDSATTQSPSLRLIGRRHLRAMNSWLHNLPSLARGPDRSALLMHPDDAQRLGFSDGQTVRVRRQSASIVARLSVTPSVMPGVISMPHGYGHAEAAQTLRTAASLPGENVNVLTDPLLVEPVIGTSILNGFSVTVEAGTPE